MDCTVVVLPSVPELGVAGGRAIVEVATGGDMSRVGTGSVGTEGTALVLKVRTADMEPSEERESEAGRTPLVKPMSMKALVAVSGRSSTYRTSTRSTSTYYCVTLPPPFRRMVHHTH